jgi:TetR/AcrR family transcriptional repressor of nem operon
MKKSKAETAETRRRIVKAAAAEFRRNGIHATGLADLMAAAGLTQGGFYRHFRSKDHLVAETCAVGLEGIVAVTDAAADDADGRGGFEAIVERYLSPDHCGDQAGCCLLVALGSELAHGDEEARAVASEGFQRLAEVIAKQFPHMTAETARARAIFALSAMIGAATMARMVPDPDLSAEILRNTREYLIKG